MVGISISIYIARGSNRIVTTLRCWQNLDDLTPGTAHKETILNSSEDDFIPLEAVNNLEGGEIIEDLLDSALGHSKR